ncbi:MAG: hypothetical protein JWM59_4636 [Verrucomicrobiales bacterium]|nr:hypothetical protein [Verrucomicrobiales bacterium]
MHVVSPRERLYDMNLSQNPCQPVAADKPDPPKPPEEGKNELKPEDFPSGDEADREDGNAGPEEKRKP